MAPKKNQKNSFLVYMQERKPQIERELKRKVKMAELPAMIHHEWKAMPDSEKSKYKEICQAAKRAGEKYDSRGIPLSQIQKEIEDQHNKIQEMRRNIKSSVGMLKSINGISNQRFSVICITYYAQNVDGSYIPAEVGVCDFSLAEGLLSFYHQIIGAKIPLGLNFEAMQHSGMTHNLYMNQCMPSKGFELELGNFLTKDKPETLVIYTLNEYLPSVEAMIENFNLKANIKIYSLDYLFKEIYSQFLTVIPESVASDMMTSCQFDYDTSLSCEFHKNVFPDSSHYCSLSCVRRWIFNLIDSLRLAETFRIQPIKGKHLPKEIDIWGGVCDVFKKIDVHEPAEVQREKDDKESFGREMFGASTHSDAGSNRKLIDPLRPVGLSPLQPVAGKAAAENAETSTAGAVGLNNVSAFPALGTASFGRGRSKLLSRSVENGPGHFG